MSDEGLNMSDIVQAPQLEKQSLIKKSASDKGEGSERLPNRLLVVAFNIG